MNKHQTVGKSLMRAPHTVTGYHGCSKQAAEGILAGAPFVPSDNDYDWLGTGIYFWEYGPQRAMEWARRRFGAEAAVVEARLRLGRCFNLLDPFHFAGLEDAYHIAVTELSEKHVLMPVNRGKVHYLDRLIVEVCCQKQGAITGVPYQTVRGCFPEGSPVFPGSRILRETHVQIAVRDGTCISRIRMVNFD